MTAEIFLTEPYFQRVLLTALLVAVVAAVLGVYLVLRGMSLFGDGIAHISFAGVALGFLVGVLPLALALAFSVLGALAIQELRRRNITKGDTAIGIIFTGSLAFGIVLLSVGTGSGVNLESYLFGNILLVTEQDFWLVGLIALVVLSLTFAARRPLLALTFDAQSAEVQGLPVRRLETLFTIATAISIVIAARIVGVLLVSSLLVVPAAASLQWARSFRQATLLSVAIALVSVVVGIAVSAEFALATGASIAVVSTTLFAVTVGIRRIVNA
jgi:zinc transport system permease protein